MAKKYISKIVKGNDDIYVKDAEAQAAISNLDSVYAKQSDIMTQVQAATLFDSIFNAND